MKIGILGAGVAGLSCAWMLKRRGVDVTVLERSAYVGGLARSFEWHGFHCDFSTHRLFTQNEEVLHQLLSLVSMGRHVRRSRIYLGGKWLHDPVNIVEVLYRFFPITTLDILWGYLTRPRSVKASSFEDYVQQRYGDGLNDFFFRPYTEKLFGIPADTISVEWARRKVRIGSPLDLIRESTKKHFSYFYYPIRGGYGAITEQLYREVHNCVKLQCTVRSLEVKGSQVESVVFEQGGEIRREHFDVLISSLPLTVLGRMLGRTFPLDYRKVDAVYLLTDRPHVSDNHWFYFIDEDVAINRLVEFKNMSAVDCPLNQTVLCAEVTAEYPDVVDKVIADVERVGLVERDEVLDTLVLREPFSYPVYDLDYQRNVLSARLFLEQFKNLYLIGRSAEFEHKELDDNFASAAELVETICADYLSAIRVKEEAAMVSFTGSGEPSVCAVVLTYNNSEDTIECLESLQALEYDNLSIVVVDNGSSDGTPGTVRDRFSGIQVIETGRNLGVPWGFNIGFTYALKGGAEYILMLNNDTVVASDMLRCLLDVGCNDPKVGILMPKVLYYDNPDVIWSAGGRYRLFPPAIVFRGLGKPDDGQFDQPRFIEYAPGCGLLIHRRAFESAGLFDPGYFFLWDDWDFSERVRAHGLHIHFVPTAKMWHKVSKTTQRGGRSDLYWRTWGESATRFYKRHGRPVFLSLPIHIGYIMLREFAKGHGRALKYFLEGVRSGLNKPLGPIPTIQSQSWYHADH